MANGAGAVNPGQGGLYSRGVRGGAAESISLNAFKAKSGVKISEASVANLEAMGLAIVVEEPGLYSLRGPIVDQCNAKLEHYGPDGNLEQSQPAKAGTYSGVKMDSHIQNKYAGKAASENGGTTELIITKNDGGYAMTSINMDGSKDALTFTPAL